MNAAQTQKKGYLIVVSGPSGSGKSTLTRELVRQTRAQLSVSATTRQPGPGEENGKDYFFLTEIEFVAKIKADEFLEYARVFDHYYGTPAAPVNEKLHQGEMVLLEIDVQGGMQVFERYPEAVGILVLPPSREELERRLRDRKRDDAETIEKRLAKAQWEIEQAQASGHYQHTIVNQDLETAIQEIVELVQSYDAGEKHT